LNTLVFDIETVPDTELGRRLYDLRDLSDEHVAQIMVTKRRQETGSEFLSHEQQRIVVISVVMRSRESLKVWSLGDEASSEKHLIERFFDGLEKFTPASTCPFCTTAVCCTVCRPRAIGSWEIPIKASGTAIT
jgi:3'-5' exonuclease